ncbi:hypothetical protein KQX54_009500 [Cotesia glomerata]|uniref:Olfactory receptor n=1 Tax=Cotesia glomerata TaxID=32391 RepID=A0AAV7IZH1_COTGL|nr:hypothetical protein KQX54_009500 [Cotesia glomerata]
MGFGWFSSLPSYFTLSLVISSLMVGMLRFLLIIALDTYQGALTMFLIVLFLNLCSISKFELLAVPHSCMPESLDFLPSSQCSCLVFNSNSFLLVFMCLAQVRRLSRCKPRYLTSLVAGRDSPYSVTGGQSPLLVVKVIWTDIVGLDFSLQFSIHDCTCLSPFCSSSEAVVGSVSAAIIAVSSAKVAVVACSSTGRSAVNRVYRNGPRTLLCGTPV